MLSNVVRLGHLVVPPANVIAVTNAGAYGGHTLLYLIGGFKVEVYIKVEEARKLLGWKVDSD